MAQPASENSAKTARRLPLWFVLLVTVMLGLTFFGERGILHVWKANRQKAELQEQIRQLEQTNADLRQEIDALRNDLRAIEDLARRQLGMVRDDELVYQFPAEQGRPPAAGQKDGQ